MPVAFDPQIPPGSSAASDFLAQYGGGANGMPSAGLPTGGLLAPDVPRLFMGTDFAKGEYNAYGYTPSPNQGAVKERTLEQAMSKFDNMSFTEQRKMLRLLAIGGFAGAIPFSQIDEYVADASQGDARAAYSMLLDTASDYWTNSNRAVTPNDVLKSAIAYRLDAYGVDWNGKFDYFNKGIPKSVAKAAGATAAGASGYDPKDFPYKKTTTSTNVDMLNPKDAKYLTRSMLQQELGRDPTQGEYEDFLSVLNAAEHENPDVQRTTTTYKLDPVTQGPYVAHQRTATTEGIGAEGLAQVAYQKAQQDPKWAEWQAMGTYFPALLSALGATVPGV